MNKRLAPKVILTYKKTRFIAGFFTKVFV